MPILILLLKPFPRYCEGATLKIELAPPQLQLLNGKTFFDGSSDKLVANLLLCDQVGPEIDSPTGTQQIDFWAL